ncbi:MAG TPA: TlpA disulfide reductase family protein [Gaiellaceae bacterium]|nr:TlpA disulfide reductase family protein [Gaiellaceae bacterium]
MSGRRAKRERAAAQAKRPQRQPVRRWKLALAVGAVVIVAAAGATLAFTRNGGSTGSAGSVAGGGSAAAPLQLSGTDPVSGRAVSLASYRGKPIVLNMWASWCTGCYAEARALATFARTHPQAQVVGVDIQDTRTAATAFYRRFGWRHPSIFDPQGVIASRFALQGLPATLFLDRRHRIVAKILGETDLAGFEAGYRKATA